MRKKLLNVLMATFALSIHLSGTGTALQHDALTEAPALHGPELIVEQPADEEEANEDGICPMSDRGDTGSLINISAP